MNTVTVSQAQNKLDILIQQVLNDSEPTFIRSADGQQTVLLPLSKYQALLLAFRAHSLNHEATQVMPSTNQRVLGLDVGSIWISDDFDEPLPDQFWFGDEEKQL